MIPRHFSIYDYIRYYKKKNKFSFQKLTMLSESGGG